MNDNDMPEYELPEWLQREQDESREREADGRIDWVKLAVWGGNAALTVALWTLAAMGAASLLGWR